jgi:predicted NodU family carbamoyl transferase|tara:strand:- start:10803 stop:11987 length:1185 start_codon:yes stop_codon:yes gene_type:complete
MRILGVNISHDSTVCELEDGIVLNLYEEERCRRKKYWSPKPESACMQTLEHYPELKDVDHVVFASFDRRHTDLEVDGHIGLDKIWSRTFLKDVRLKQLSRERMDDLHILYPEFSFKDQWDNADEKIVDTIMGEQFSPDEKASPESHYRVDHHLYHAWSAVYFSPYESAHIIVWDGGGAKKFFDTHPLHQEIESIYKLDNKEVTLQYQKLSAARAVDDLSAKYFPNELWESCTCLESEFMTDTESGAEIEFTSFPSSGMNFSNMSQALGTDDLGRAAGKVMGMASYGNPMENVHTQFTAAQQVEIDSFNASCKTIQKALDLDPECKNIILSGGYSLNCTNNYKYLSAFPDVNFFIDPVPHDGGTALGAAVQFWDNLPKTEKPYVKNSTWTTRETV